jgi:hypothetical protein
MSDFSGCQVVYQYKNAMDKKIQRHLSHHSNLRAAEHSQALQPALLQQNQGQNKNKAKEAR